MVENVYETLVTYAGNSTSTFVPELATCVPGTTQCISDYGSSLIVNGTGAFAHEPVYWTFVIDPSARFYDPQSGASWGVYPSDVMFSVARDLIWADPYGTTPGWILGQALLPGASQSNASWDGGLHAPFNNTPAMVLGSMLVNNSTYCPSAALADAHGCITFVAEGGGLSWGEFLQFIAMPWGSSIAPCGWFTYESAGVPNWTGPSANRGDAPCRLPDGATSTNGGLWSTYLGELSPTGWDAAERLIYTHRNPQPNVADQLVGSGPYYASEVNLSSNYELRANPAYAAPIGCRGDDGLAGYNLSDCLPDPRGYIGNVSTTWEGAALTGGLSAAENGTSDVAAVAMNSTAAWLSLQREGDATIDEIPSEVDFGLSLDLNWNPTAFMNSGYPGLPNVPANFLAGPAARGLLTSAFPYAQVENSLWTVDGIQYLIPSGGPIPRFMQPYSGAIYPPSGNVSFPNGSPDPDPNDVGGAAWWWDQGRDNASAYFDPQLASCTVPDPCSFPIVGIDGDPLLDDAIGDYISALEAITAGAVQPYTFDLPIAQELTNLTDFPVGFEGWAPDYPDPSDYTMAFSQPNGAFSGQDGFGEVFSEPAYNDSALCGYSAVTAQDLGYWSAQAAPSPSCQGVAYGVAEGWMLQLANEPTSPARVADYDLVTKILNSLNLEVWYGQSNTIQAFAPWINQSSINTNPILGGNVAPFWYQLRYTTGTSTPTPPPTTVGVAPGTPLYDPANNEVYVPNAGSASVSVLSGTTDDLLTNIPVGTDPQTPVLDPRSGAVFVANFLSGNVTVINASTDLVVANLPVGGGPRVPTYDPAYGELFVPNNDSNNVSVVNGTTYRVVATVAVGSEPDTAAYDAANGELYVPNFGSGTVSVLNGAMNTVVTTVDVGSGPSPPVYDPADGDIYVPNLGSGNISVIWGTSNQVVATILVGSLPFVVQGGDGPAPIFSRTTAPAGAPLFDPANDEIYVANAGSSSVSVINGTTYQVTATVAVGTEPQAPVLDPASGNIYVANSGSDNLSVIAGDSNTVVATVDTGGAPTPPVVDNATGQVYEASAASDNVSAIPAAFYVSFVASGLPTGASWRLAFATLPSSTAAVFSRTTVPYAERNGTYAYTIAGPAGYRVAPSLAPSGTIAVSGADVVVRVDFVLGKTYAATFDESGLPKGTGWCATVGWVVCSTTTKLSVANLTPGQYPFAIGTVDGFSLVVHRGGAAYSAPGRLFNISRRGVTVTSTFKELRYAVTFAETGLAVGKSWNVLIQYVFYGRTTVVRASSKHATIVVELPNATFTYQVGSVKGYAPGASGTETVDGAPLSIPVTYSKS